MPVKKLRNALLGEVLFEKQTAWFSNDDAPGFVALTCDCEFCNLALQLHVSNGQIADFLRSRAACVHQVQQHFVAQADFRFLIREKEQRGDFFE